MGALAARASAFLLWAICIVQFAFTFTPWYGSLSLYALGLLGSRTWYIDLFGVTLQCRGGVLGDIFDDITSGRRNPDFDENKWKACRDGTAARDPDYCRARVPEFKSRDFSGGWSSMVIQPGAERARIHYRPVKPGRFIKGGENDKAGFLVDRGTGERLVRTDYVEVYVYWFALIAHAEAFMFLNLIIGGAFTVATPGSEHALYYSVMFILVLHIIVMVAMLLAGAYLWFYATGGKCGLNGNDGCCKGLVCCRQGGVACCGQRRRRFGGRGRRHSDSSRRGSRSGRRRSGHVDDLESALLDAEQEEKDQYVNGYASKNARKAAMIMTAIALLLQMMLILLCVVAGTFMTANHGMAGMITGWFAGKGSALPLTGVIGSFVNLFLLGLALAHSKFWKMERGEHVREQRKEAREYAETLETMLSMVDPNAPLMSGLPAPGELGVEPRRATVLSSKRSSVASRRLWDSTSSDAFLSSSGLSGSSSSSSSGASRSSSDYDSRSRSWRARASRNGLMLKRDYSSSEASSADDDVVGGRPTRSSGLGYALQGESPRSARRRRDAARGRPTAPPPYDNAGIYRPNGDGTFGDADAVNTESFAARYSPPPMEPEYTSGQPEYISQW